MLFVFSSLNGATAHAQDLSSSHSKRQAKLAYCLCVVYISKQVVLLGDSTYFFPDAYGV